MLDITLPEPSRSLEKRWFLFSHVSPDASATPCKWLDEAQKITGEIAKRTRSSLFCYVEPVQFNLSSFAMFTR